MVSPSERELRATGSPSANGTAFELRELRYFAVLCEELHFGRAAGRLHISQSPLSQAIAQLERKLGTRLLDRSSRHVQLTAAGQVLREHGARLLRDADAAVGATRRAGAGEVGVLRIACGPVTHVAILPALRHELDERVPTLDVDVAEMLGEDVPESVLHGDADIGLMLFAPKRADIDTKLLRCDKPVAVVHPSHPLAAKKSVTVAELAEHTLVLWPRATSQGAHDTVLSMFHGHKPAATRVAATDAGASWDAMRHDGFAVVASSAPVGGDLVTVPVDGTDVEFAMSLIWSRRTSPAVLHQLLEAADAAIAANGWL